jgi:DNA polymerase III subunit gamma/tau
MGLYQKHRPKTFDEVKGNRDVVASLKAMLKDKETMPHSFLFYGGTGTGKTTLARIIANELGCTENNIIEIDTAQFRGIDTIRDLRKNAQYTPLGGGDRVYIIDECHAITGAASDAFLKLLEDTPKHVFFILCTTDPDKLSKTIKGRCSQFQTSVLSNKLMGELLFEVAEKEGVTIDDELIKVITESSQGHPRNALTILEQVLQVPEKRRLKAAKIASEGKSESIALCRALMYKKGWREIAVILKGLKTQDPESIRRVVLGYATSVLLNKDNEMAYYILECFEEPTYNIGFPGIVLACQRVLNYE